MFELVLATTISIDVSVGEGLINLKVFTSDTNNLHYNVRLVERTTLLQLNLVPITQRQGPRTSRRINRIAYETNTPIAD